MTENDGDSMQVGMPHGQKPRTNAGANRFWQGGLLTGVLGCTVLAGAAGSHRVPNPLSTDPRLCAVTEAHRAAELFTEAKAAYSRHIGLVNIEGASAVDSTRVRLYSDSAAHYRSLESTLTVAYSSALDSARQWEASGGVTQRHPKAMAIGANILLVSMLCFGMSGALGIYHSRKS